MHEFKANYKVNKRKIRVASQDWREVFELIEFSSPRKGRYVIFDK